MVKLYHHLMLVFLTLAVVVVTTTRGALSPENYWRTKLPTTPMPKALRGFLQSLGVRNGGNAAVGGKDGVVPYDVGSSKTTVIRAHYEGPPETKASTDRAFNGGQLGTKRSTDRAFNSGQPGTKRSTDRAFNGGQPGTKASTTQSYYGGQPGTKASTTQSYYGGQPGTKASTTQSYYGGQPGTKASTKGPYYGGQPGTKSSNKRLYFGGQPGTKASTMPASYGGQPGSSPGTKTKTMCAYYSGQPGASPESKTIIKHANCDGSPGKIPDKFQLNPNNLTLYFLEKDLIPGKFVKLNLTKISYQVSFQPRQVSESIPFSSNKLAEIFNALSVKPESTEAKIITETLEICEGPGIKGEDKYCATSLESMIDFSISKLGNNPLAISTENNGSFNKLEKYKISANGLTKTSGDKPVVVCHVQGYAYAVFYCHELKGTIAYSVPLVGVDDGSTTKVKGVAVCHRDTSGWNPKHLAFQLLNVKPGDGNSICHILDEGTIVWVPRH